MNKNIAIAVLVVIVVALFGYIVVKNDPKPVAMQPIMENQQPVANTSPAPQSESTASWKSFSNLEFSINYPAGWTINEYGPAPGMPGILFTSNTKATSTDDRSGACVQLSGGYNGPIRTDKVGIAQALLDLANSKLDETFVGNNIQVLSTTPITVNGRPAIERKITGGNETTPTYEVFVLGEVSHINDKFPGTFYDIYTLHSCVTTEKSVFDTMVQSLIINRQQ